MPFNRNEQKAEFPQYLRNTRVSSFCEKSANIANNIHIIPKSINGTEIQLRIILTLFLLIILLHSNSGETFWQHCVMEQEICNCKIVIERTENYCWNIEILSFWGNMDGWTSFRVKFLMKGGWSTAHQLKAIHRVEDSTCQCSSYRPQVLNFAHVSFLIGFRDSKYLRCSKTQKEPFYRRPCHTPNRLLWLIL